MKGKTSLRSVPCQNQSAATRKDFFVHVLHRCSLIWFESLLHIQGAEIIAPCHHTTNVTWWYLGAWNFVAI